MSQSSTQAAVQQALAGDGPLTPEGSAKAQVKKDTTYVAVPSTLAQHYEISQSDELMRYYNAATDCLVIPLDNEIDFTNRYRTQLPPSFLATNRGGV